jgi:integrase
VVIDEAEALRRAVLDVFDHPVLGRCQLHEIRNVRDRPVEGACPTTLRQAVGLLRSVYGAAVLDRLVASSPVVRIQPPRHEREPVVSLSVEQVAALARAMPERYRAMVLTQAGLGLRIGELLAPRPGRRLPTPHRAHRVAVHPGVEG